MSGVAKNSNLPPVDERLVAPESRFEIWDGRVEYVAPADEPHATRHSKISALLEAHVSADYEVGSDMLTRTSELNDIAPDASVFPAARDAKTGSRQLEELAFEVASTESLSHAGSKAQRLAARGVRRIFAVDVTRERAVEWSVETGTWRILDQDSYIEDRAFAAPLPVRALVSSAKADDAMAAALLQKRNSVLVAALDQERSKGMLEGEAKGMLEGKAKGVLEGKAKGVLEGKAEGKAEGMLEGKAKGMLEALLAVLSARGLTPSEQEREQLASERNAPRLAGWLKASVHCSTVRDLFES